MGVALVDLSVLTYSPLDVIRRVFASLGAVPAAIDAYRDRGPDFVWLERQARAKTFRKTLGIAPSASDKPKGASPGLSLDGLARLRRSVDLAIMSQPAESTEESADLRQRRQELAEFLRTYMVTHPATDAEIALDWRNRAPRVLAFMHGSNAYIAFRGSATTSDWRRNAMFWPAGRLPLRHKGFEVIWAEVRAHVEAWLAQVTRELGSKPTVHLGGHSLGGAVATLAAIDLAALEYPIARVVTLGSPRVGGWKFRKLYRSTDAAPDADGNSRCLAEVTTRFVHGSDAVTIVPPWPFTVHVVPRLRLKAEDRLSLEDFVGNGLYDTGPLMALVSGASALPTTGYTGGLSTASKPVGRIKLWRTVATQVGAVCAMHFPAHWWTRVLPFVAAFLEQMRVSLGQHRSARYWAFLPPTVLRRAYAAVAKSESSARATMEWE